MKVVTWARLHNSIYIPGIGEIGPLLPSPNKKVSGFKMTLEGDVIRIHSPSILNADFAEVPKTNAIAYTVKEEKPLAAVDETAA